jgi:hypothetical protein
MSSSLAAEHVVGVQPILPASLAGWDWWTKPVRAEGLAALRIGVGLVLLFDMLVTYAPHWRLFFAPQGLGTAKVFSSRFGSDHAYFSLASLFPAETAGWWMVALTALAGIGLITGILPRVSALVGWALTLTMLNENYYLHNGGDRLRSILLFVLVFAPADAVWSLKSHCQNQKNDQHPTFIYPWAQRLLFVQLTLLYFMNGVYKLFGTEWFEGDTLYYVSHDIWWSRLSADWAPVHYLVLRIVTWSVLAWEITFPLAILSRRYRPWALALGAMFHVLTGMTLNLGVFPLYALCFYLPELPWGNWRAALWTTPASPAPHVHARP